MTYETILYDVEDRIAHTTLNQPAKSNVLNWTILLKYK